jgi:hypothetical protein
MSAPDVTDSCGDNGPCTTTVPSGTSVTLSASDGFVLANPLVVPSVNWSGACTGDWPVCSLVVDGSTSVTVGQPQALRVPAAISVAPRADVFTATVSGPGRVRVEGYASTCPSTCVWNLPDERDVKLVAAKAGKHARFVGWKRGFCHGRRPSCPVKIGPGEFAAAVFRRS